MDTLPTVPPPKGGSFYEIPCASPRRSHRALQHAWAGSGGIQQAPAAEIRQVIETAIAHGINFFDLCAGAAKTYAPFGQAIRGRREQVFFQLHLGAVYNESGEYGWSRDLSEIQRTFAWELETLAPTMQTSASSTV